MANLDPINKIIDDFLAFCAEKPWLNNELEYLYLIDLINFYHRNIQDILRRHAQLPTFSIPIEFSKSVGKNILRNSYAHKISAKGDFSSEILRLHDDYCKNNAKFITVDNLRITLNHDPDSPFTIYKNCITCRHESKFDLGFRLANIILNQQPESIPFLNICGWLSESSGDFENAIGFASRAIDKINKYKNDPIQLFKLSYGMIDQFTPGFILIFRAKNYARLKNYIAMERDLLNLDYDSIEKAATSDLKGGFGLESWELNEVLKNNNAMRNNDKEIITHVMPFLNKWMHPLDESY